MREFTMSCLLIVIAAGAPARGDDTPSAPAPHTPSLTSVLSTAKTQDFGRTLDRIATLDEAGSAADKTLVHLLNYYLGAGPSEALAEAITKRGTRMLPSLRALRAQPPKCLQEYAALCEDKNEADIQARNAFIDRLIDAIVAHKVLRMES
jgi:hypothetical protein